jgi:hypothetical protein
VTRTAAALALALSVAAGCYSVPEPLPVTGHDVVLAQALADGDFERAEEFMRRALAREPDSASVRLWAAALAEMAGRDQEAVLHLREVLRSTDRGGLDEAEVHGRLGDVLFRLGRYGEAAPHLFAATRGADAARWRAFAELATLLPPVAEVPRDVAAELALRPGPMPELFCRFDQAERPFVLDTGATFTTLSQTLATELGVRPLLPAGVGRDGSGREIPLQAGLVRAFGLGAIRLGMRPVLVVDDQRLAMQDARGGPERAPLGVVGIDVLGQFQVTFRPSRGSIGITPGGTLKPAESVPCLRVEGRLLAPVWIEGKQLWFVVDTGATESSLTGPGLRVLPGGESRATPAFRQVRTPGGSGYAVREVRDLILTVSEVRFTGVALLVVERVPLASFPVHGVLGADLLLRCRTVLDGGRLRMEQG